MKDLFILMKRFQFFLNTLFYVLILFTFNTIHFYRSSIYACPSEEMPIFKIFMVLWSGKTDLEKGFLSYLRSKKVPFTTEIHDCEGSREKCHALVSKIREKKPDLLYIWGTPACEEIAGRIDQPKSNYIWDIPIIGVAVTDPLHSKIVMNRGKSDTRSGRNFTAVTHTAPVEVHLKTILMYDSDIKKIAIIYNPEETNSYSQVIEFKNLAVAHDIQIIDLPIPLKDKKPDPSRIIDNVRYASKEGADFLYIPSDNFLSVHSDILLDTAHGFNIPTFGTTESLYCKKKPLLGVFSRFIHVGAFAGYKAYEILVHQKKPSEISIEKLSRFAVVISKDTLNRSGHVPPIPLLKIAKVQ